MTRRSRILITGLAASAAVLSCDDGRLVTDVEQGPFAVDIQAPAGPDSLYVGQELSYETRVTLGEAAVTSPVVRWSTTPAGLLFVDSTDHGFITPVRGLAPGVATLTVRVEDPSLQSDESSRPIHVLLLGVGAVAPANGDTTLTAVGDGFTVRARGIGMNGATVDSADLRWTHRGSALSILPPLTGRDELAVEAVAAGTDTLIFAQGDGHCVHGQCTDTILVRVVQTPAQVQVADTVRFATLGRTASPAATVLDGNGHPIPGAAVTWSLAVPADSDRVKVTESGDLTAISNGTVAVIARAGGAEDTVTVVVRQVIHSVEVPTAITLSALGAADTLAAPTADSAGSPVARAYTVTWTSRDPPVAGVTALSADSAAIRAEAVGSTWVVAEAESVRDSVLVTVGQEVATVMVTPDTLNALGDAIALAAEALDANGSVIPGTSFTWSVDTPAILELLASGDEVVSLATGQGQVTATAGGVSGSGSVLSRQIAGTVSIAPSFVPDPLLPGDTLLLSVTVADSNGVAMPGVSDWSSENTGVATVDASGNVTAQAVAALDSTRVVAILAPTADTVWVLVEPALVSSLAVTPESVRLTSLGATAQLSAAAANQRGDRMPGESVTWSSLDVGVATVDAAGTVTAVADGTTGVIATSTSNPAVADTAAVVVEQEVATVTVTPDSHTFDALEATQQFQAAARDALGSLVSTTITWIDDAASPGVITVSANGLVTAEKVGTSKVVASADGKADSADVTVQQLPAAITTAPAVDTVAVGATTTLTASVLDGEGHVIPGHSVDWTSFETALATVTPSDGVVTGVAPTSGVDIRAVPTGHLDIRATTQVVVTAYVLAFDGDDHASAGDALPLDSAWTIEAWVKPGTLTGTQYLLSRGGAASNPSSAYGLYLQDDKPSVFTRAKAGINKDTHLVSETPLPTGWSHVAVTFDAAMLRMYINGAPTDSIAHTVVPQNTTASLFFGASDSGGANSYMGSLDELRFWGVTRTADEIAASYATPLAGSEPDPDLLAWWPLRAGAGHPVDLVGSAVMALPADPADPAWVSEWAVIP